MPVLVHAAHRPLGRRLVARLCAEGGQVRALASSSITTLRASGAFVATGDPDDEGRLEAALTDAHTLVFIAGGLASIDPQRTAHEAVVAARAAEGAGVQRVVLVTLVGADLGSADALRRAHGEVSATFASITVPSVELRCGLVLTRRAQDLLVTAGLSDAARACTVAPVHADDLVELVVAVDDARSTASSGHAVLSADGPERISVQGLLEVHRGRAEATAVSVAPRLTGRRLPSDVERDALEATLRGPWWNEDPSIPSAWSLFGLTPVPVTSTAAGSE